MPLFNWPYTNLHNLNLDWIIKKIKNVETAESNTAASKEAAAGSAASAAESEAHAAESETNAAASATAAGNYYNQIRDNVSTLVTGWMDEHITPTTPPVDDTLTIQGAAADAKKTGDEIAACFKYVKSAQGTEYSNLLSHIVQIGSYYISKSQTFNDRPVNASLDTGASLVNIPFETSIVLQTFTDARGYSVIRLVNTTTFKIIGNMQDISDANGWTTGRSLNDLITDSFKFRRLFVGLTEDVNIVNITENGWYGIQASSKPHVIGLPEDTYSSLTLLVMSRTYASNSISLQLLFDQAGDLWWQIINNSTHKVVTAWKKLIDTPVLKRRWDGKTIACWGDSRTWYDGKKYTANTKAEWTGRTCIGYQKTLAELTGATIQTHGYSGATSATICNNIREADFTGVDAVLLEGGVNDYIKASQVTIGTLQPIGSLFDTETVYGSWQSAVEYILNNYPSVKIFMTVPAIAWNASGVMPYTTAEIKKNVAELYNIPCLDLYKNGGINELNRDYYYVDDVAATNWRLHFNDYGNALIGAEMAGFINTH